MLRVLMKSFHMLVRKRRTNRLKGVKFHIFNSCFQKEIMAVKGLISTGIFIQDCDCTYPAVQVHWLCEACFHAAVTVQQETIDVG